MEDSVSWNRKYCFYSKSDGKTLEDLRSKETYYALVFRMIIWQKCGE